jgi:hypothetical protein
MGSEFREKSLKDSPNLGRASLEVPLEALEATATVSLVSISETSPTSSTAPQPPLPRSANRDTLILFASRHYFFSRSAGMKVMPTSKPVPQSEEGITSLRARSTTWAGRANALTGQGLIEVGPPDAEWCGARNPGSLNGVTATDGRGPKYSGIRVIP